MLRSFLLTALLAAAVSAPADGPHPMFFATRNTKANYQAIYSSSIAPDGGALRVTTHAVEKAVYTPDDDARCFEPAGDGSFLLFQKLTPEDENEATRAAVRLRAEYLAKGLEPPPEIPAASRPRFLHVAAIDRTTGAPTAMRQLSHRGFIQKYDAAPDAASIAWATSDGWFLARRTGENAGEIFGAEEKVDVPLLDDESCASIYYTADSRFVLFSTIGQKGRLARLFSVPVSAAPKAVLAPLPAGYNISTYLPAATGSRTIVAGVSGRLVRELFALEPPSTVAKLPVPFSDDWALDDFRGSADNGIVCFSALDRNANAPLLGTVAASGEGGFTELARVYDMLASGRFYPCISADGKSVAWVNRLESEPGTYAGMEVMLSSAGDAEMPAVRISPPGDPRAEINRLAIVPGGKWLLWMSRDAQTRLPQMWFAPADASGQPALVSIGSGHVVDNQAIAFSADGALGATLISGAGAGREIGIIQFGPKPAVTTINPGAQGEVPIHWIFPGGTRR